MPEIGEDNKNVKNGRIKIGAGLASYGLNVIPVVSPYLANAASGTLIGQGINDILNAIFDEDNAYD